MSLIRRLLTRLRHPRRKPRPDDRDASIYPMF